MSKETDKKDNEKALSPDVDLGKAEKDGETPATDPAKDLDQAKTVHSDSNKAKESTTAPKKDDDHTAAADKKDKKKVAAKEEKTAATADEHSAKPAKKPARWVAVCASALVGLGCGVAIGAYAFGGGASVVKVGDKTYRTNEVVKDIGGNTSAVTAYRSILTKNALEQKYGSSALNKQVDSQFAQLQNKYKGGKWKTFLQSNNFANDQAVKTALRNNLLMNKYLESKVTTSDIKSAYQNFIPMQGIAYQQFKSKSEAQSAVDKYNKAGVNKDNFNKWIKGNNRAQRMNMSSINNTFDYSEFKTLATGKLYEAHLMKVSGNDTYLMVVLTKKQSKGSYEAEAPVIRQLLETKLTTNSAKFGKTFVKDMKIKGVDTFGKNVVKSYETPVAGLPGQQ